MQDADLFMELAGIAGVFVGFGALVAVLAALAPVVISRYGLTEHEVWALSSILLLVGFVGIFAINNLSPEARAADEGIPRRILVVHFAVWVSCVIILFLAPIAIALGVAPVREEAPYFTLVALALFGFAIALLMLVLTGRRSQPASDPAALPAAGVPIA